MYIIKGLLPSVLPMEVRIGFMAPRARKDVSPPPFFEYLAGAVIMAIENNAKDKNLSNSTFR